MSAQVDRFVHDRLPPRRAAAAAAATTCPSCSCPTSSTWSRSCSTRRCPTGWRTRPMLRSPSRTLSYAEAAVEVDRIAQVLTRRPGPGARQPRAAARRQLHRDGARLAGRGQGRADRRRHHAAAAREGAGRHHRQGAAALALCDGQLLDELQIAQERAAGAADPRAHSIAPDAADSLTRARLPRAAPFSACPTAADDIALMAFTSGTTGKPKAPVHMHRDVIAMCEAWPRHVLQARSDDIVRRLAAAGLHLRPRRHADLPDVGRRLACTSR